MEKTIAAATIEIVESKGAMNSSTHALDCDDHSKAKLSEIAGVASTATAADQVRVIRPDEYKAAALSLAEAFATDAVARYFIDTPDRTGWTEEQKWDLHVKTLEYITYAHCLKGLVLTAGPNYEGVALWMPPGKNMDDWYTVLRSGMWRLRWMPGMLSTEGKARFFTEFLPLLHATKYAVMGARDDDSWYLVYLGVRPDGRGKGYARKLIEYVTRKADTEGKACYLESSNASNPAIYRKMGFETVKQIELCRSHEHVELDIMVREPPDVPTRPAGAEYVATKRSACWIL